MIIRNKKNGKIIISDTLEREEGKLPEGSTYADYVDKSLLIMCDYNDLYELRLSCDEWEEVNGEIDLFKKGFDFGAKWQREHNEEAVKNLKQMAAKIYCWHTIERDKNGFATNECLNEIFSNNYFAVWDEKNKELSFVSKPDYNGWRGEIELHTQYNSYFPLDINPPE